MVVRTSHPSEWVALPIIEIVRNIIDHRGRTPRKLGTKWGGGDIPALSANNVKMGYIDLEDSAHYGSEALYERWMTQGKTFKDDLIITVEAPLGNVALIPDNRKYIVSQRTVVLQTRDDLVFNKFLLHFMMSEFFQNILLQNSTGSTATGIRRKKFETLEVLLPPLPEQHAIATALSDVDALLNSMDALTAKKRLVKQGAMQELLTGKKRLPGFGGEWKTKSLSELFNISGGFTASRDQLSSNGYCYLHYGDIHLSNKTFIDVTTEFENIPKLNVPLKKISEASLLKDGDVVFVDASEDDEGTSRHVVVANPDGIPFISGLHTIVAKSKTDELVNLYRRFCFQTRAVKNQFLFYAVGTKVSGISKSNIAKIKIIVPSVPEQTAIAEILSDMDAEISALEQKREKTRLLKQGMMQELLTGRIRLI